jgi:hypothetical protein
MWPNRLIELKQSFSQSFCLVTGADGSTGTIGLEIALCRFSSTEMKTSLANVYHPMFGALLIELFIVSSF